MSELRLVVDIPFAPPKAASPNSRVHWSKRSKETRVYREAARLAARDAYAIACANGQWSSRPLLEADHDIEIQWTIYWPKWRQAKDDDNAIMCAKAARDGIADAIGIDDRHFTTAVPIRQERDPEGRGRTVAVVTARRKEET